MKYSATLWLVLFPLLASAQSGFHQTTLSYYDSTRNRKLVTALWLPAGSSTSQLPLVLFSHGTGGNRLACKWFCEGLARNGFMVVAVDHYGNTFDNPIPREFITIWQRPQDISYVLTQLLKDNRYAPAIDKKRIHAAGFSLGGYTVLALGGARISWQSLIRFLHTPEGYKEVNIPEMPGLVSKIEDPEIVEAFEKAPNLQDKRIKSVFAMAPAGGQGFQSPRQFRGMKIPVFIAGAEADSIAPVKTNAAHYKSFLPAAQWELVKGGAGHYVFLNSGTEEMIKAAPVFFKDAHTVNRDSVHALMLQKAVLFFSMPGNRKKQSR